MQSYIKKYELMDVLNEPLLKHISIGKYKKGEYIVQEGQIPEYLYFLVEGRAKYYASSEEGKLLVLGFTHPLTVIGDIEFLKKLPYLNTVEAVTNITVLRIPLTIIQQEGLTYLPFVSFILDIITRKFYVNNKTVNLNFLYGVDVRVASYILSMTESEETLPVAHLRDAAEFIGTTYRHLNRVLLKFIEEGIITRKEKKIIVLDREQLFIRAKNNVYEER